MKKRKEPKLLVLFSNASEMIINDFKEYVSYLNEDENVDMIMPNEVMKNEFYSKIVKEIDKKKQKKSFKVYMNFQEVLSLQSYVAIGCIHCDKINEIQAFITFDEKSLNKLNGFIINTNHTRAFRCNTKS